MYVFFRSCTNECVLSTFPLRRKNSLHNKLLFTCTVYGNDVSVVYDRFIMLVFQIFHSDVLIRFSTCHIASL